MPHLQAKRSFRYVIFVVLAGLVGSRTQAQDSTLTRLVERNHYSLTQNGPQFSGPGWEKLQHDIQISQFVLVGEDHGMAQIPVFTTAVARELKPAVYVSEVDEYQAQEVTRLTAQPALPTAFERQHPGALSFFSWAEEFELARYLRSQQVILMGIEQVGGAFSGRLFELLAAEVKSKPAKLYLQQRAVAYQARDRASMVGNTNTGTMSFLRQSGIDSLRSFTKMESPKVQKMVRDFVASYTIYQAQRQRTGGHQERINLMKRNLLQGLQAYSQRPSQPLPKMLFKFGASHMARNLSPWAGISDVGNLVTNLADAQDQKSLHIMIMGKQGTQVAGENPDDFSKNVAPYSYAEEAYLKPFLPATNAAWNVVDLRPTRRAILTDKLQVTNQKLEAIILGYDYIVIIPETTASHNY
ncbi:hypothetical protein [Hymenobacter radiodurans]|uniref:hypothetical protein n=1 Tax=Hymenobacter radiodurans TaxID=2496028 RepID=UPI001058A1DA|nr:hypothetical protein [Hymenobacter radiodurans]